MKTVFTSALLLMVAQSQLFQDTVYKPTPSDPLAFSNADQDLIKVDFDYALKNEKIVQTRQNQVMRISFDFTVHSKLVNSATDVFHLSMNPVSVE